MIPAAGQGILAVQGIDGLDYEFLKGYDDLQAHQAATAERAFVKYLNGGCTSPVAAYGEIKDGQLKLTGLYYEKDWTLSEGYKTGNPSDAEKLGTSLAKELQERCKVEYKESGLQEDNKKGTGKSLAGGSWSWRCGAFYNERCPGSGTGRCGCL